MNTETYISITATAISLSAFGVAVWQGYLTRKHNRLSVKPMLHFNTGIVGDDYVIELRNTGVGPAILKDCKITFNGNKIGDNPHHIIKNLFNKLGIEHLSGGAYIPGENESMAPGDKHNIFKIYNLKYNEETKDRIINDILWLQIAIKYESIYSESQLVILNEDNGSDKRRK